MTYHIYIVCVCRSRRNIYDVSIIIQLLSFCINSFRVASAASRLWRMIIVNLIFFIFNNLSFHFELRLPQLEVFLEIFEIFSELRPPQVAQFGVAAATIRTATIRTNSDWKFRVAAAASRPKRVKFECFVDLLQPPVEFVFVFDKMFGKRRRKPELASLMIQNKKKTLFPAIWRVVSAPWFITGTHGHWTQIQDRWQPRTVTHACKASLEVLFHC